MPGRAQVIAIMKRLLPYSLVLVSAAAAYACSSSDSGSSGSSGSSGTTDPTEEVDGSAVVGDEDGGTEGGGGEAAVEAGTVDPTGNPILLGPAREIRTFTPAGGAPHFVDGPAWSQGRSSLFVALPYAATLQGGKGILASFKIDGTSYTEHRAGDTVAGSGVVGTSIDKDGNLIAAELKSVTRTLLPATGSVGAPTVIAAGYGDATTPTPFDGPNDLVGLADGTIFVTDPGYGVGARPPVGHLFVIAPGAPVAQIAQEYPNNPAPNGIAVSKDEKTLYVGFTEPAVDGSILPFVRKYTIGAGGALTDEGKLFEVPVGSAPDGIAVDENNNIYVALATGIAVFKPTGEPYGGAGAKIPQRPVVGEPTGLSFGGPDKKSLFVTIKGGKALELRTTVAGLRH
jgi:gluconolactonase